MENNQKKLDVEEFTLLAIEKLKLPERDSIHVVYSNFNQAFREYFPGLDPVAEIKKLVEAKKIGFRLARGGAIIFLPGTVASPEAKDTLKKMGLGK